MDQSLLQRIKKGASGKRGVSFYLLIASLVFTLVMLISYSRTGTNTFTPVLSQKVISRIWVCVALSALLAVWEIKNGKYILYLLSFWTWLEFLVYNASYISNVMVGIDGNLFSIGFLLTAVSGLLAWGLALASAILQKNEIGSQNKAVGNLQTEE